MFRTAYPPLKSEHTRKVDPLPSPGLPRLPKMSGIQPKSGNVWKFKKSLEIVWKQHTCLEKVWKWRITFLEEFSKQNISLFTKQTLVSFVNRNAMKSDLKREYFFFRISKFLKLYVGKVYTLQSVSLNLESSHTMFRCISNNGDRKRAEEYEMISTFNAEKSSKYQSIRICY